MSDIKTGPGYTKKNADVEAGVTGNHAKASGNSTSASGINASMNGEKKVFLTQKFAALPLWLKIVIPCVIAVIIILVVLFATGIVGGSGEDKNAIVPDVVGEYYENAITIADDSDMLLVITGKENSDVVEQNNILQQDPKAKAEAPKGSALLGVVSGGESVSIEPVVMPDVIFLSEEDAIAMLNEAGISYKINYIENDNVLDGLVAGQIPLPNTKMDENEAAEIYLSTGSDAQREAIEKSGKKAKIPTPISSTTISNNDVGGSDADVGMPIENEHQLITVVGTIIDNVFVDEYNTQAESYSAQYGGVDLRGYGIRFDSPVTLPTGVTISEAGFSDWDYPTGLDTREPEALESLIGTPLTMTGYITKETRMISEMICEYSPGKYMYYPQGSYDFNLVSIEGKVLQTAQPADAANAQASNQVYDVTATGTIILNDVINKSALSISFNPPVTLPSGETVYIADLGGFDVEKLPRNGTLMTFSGELFKVPEGVDFMVNQWLFTCDSFEE